MTQHKQRILVVAGPTASGKSDLAITLARRFDGEIISADSRQVYRGLDVATGKVTKAERRLVRHWLLDVASPARQYSVARFVRDARTAIRDITRRGKLPIICGGTGFWIDALVYGRNIPDVKPDAKLRGKLNKLSVGHLYARLKKLDPDRAATIDHHNKVRLVRALEIVLTTGKPVPKNSMIYHTVPEYEVLYLGVGLPWKKLTGRIERRVDSRLRGGMVAEAKRLYGNGLSFRRMASLGLEYRWLARFLKGDITRRELRDGILKDDLAYAKRQTTWWRRNPHIRWVRTKSDALSLTKSFLN